MRRVFYLCSEELRYDCYFAAELLEAKFKVPRFEETGSIVVRCYVRSSMSDTFAGSGMAFSPVYAVSGSESSHTDQIQSCSLGRHQRDLLA